MRRESVTYRGSVEYPIITQVVLRDVETNRINEDTCSLCSGKRNRPPGHEIRREWSLRKHLRSMEVPDDCRTEME